MKKLLLVFIIFILVGCSNNSAKLATERYLNKYKTLDGEVLIDMESIIEKENLSKDNEETYRTVLKKQYKDLSYKILEEEYDDEVSYVTVKISVYDLYKAQKDASLYYENNKSEFDNEEDYMKYRLDKMKNMNDRIEYTIIFTVTKENDVYNVMQPTENDLKKIHGIYNYELN